MSSTQLPVAVPPSAAEAGGKEISLRERLKCKTGCEVRNWANNTYHRGARQVVL